MLLVATAVLAVWLSYASRAVSEGQYVKTRVSEHESRHTNCAEQYACHAGIDAYLEPPAWKSNNPFSCLLWA
jgi:hypothetical protein